MISIRLSDAEYQGIKSYCCGTGTLNVSEFVRAAVIRALASPEVVSNAVCVEREIVVLHKRLDEFDRRVDQLAAHVGFPLTDEAATSEHERPAVPAPWAVR
jgi:hypothetical protein